MAHARCREVAAASRRRPRPLPSQDGRDRRPFPRHGGLRHRALESRSRRLGHARRIFNVARPDRSTRATTPPSCFAALGDPPRSRRPRHPPRRPISSRRHQVYRTWLAPMSRAQGRKYASSARRRGKDGAHPGLDQQHRHPHGGLSVFAGVAAIPARGNDLWARDDQSGVIENRRALRQINEPPGRACASGLSGLTMAE